MKIKKKIKKKETHRVRNNLAVPNHRRLGQAVPYHLCILGLIEARTPSFPTCLPSWLNIGEKRKYYGVSTRITWLDRNKHDIHWFCHRCHCGLGGTHDPSISMELMPFTNCPTIIVTTAYFVLNGGFSSAVASTSVRFNQAPVHGRLIVFLDLPDLVPSTEGSYNLI